MRMYRGSIRSLCFALLTFAILGPIAGFGIVGCGSGVDLGSGSVTVTPPPVNVTTPGGTITFAPSPFSFPLDEGPQGETSSYPSPGTSPSVLPSPTPF